MSNIMTIPETMERFSEGLKKAESRAIELGKMTSTKEWLNVAKQLRIFRENGMKLYYAGKMNRQEALAMVDRKALQLGNKLN